jgi:hypothetical protein
MQKYFRIILFLILTVGLGSPLMAIDGDFGSPYAPDQGSTPPAQRVPGAEISYGGMDADVPAMTLFGGVLVILGAGATGIWWRRSRLSAP